MIVAASFDTTDPAMWFNRAMQYGDGVFETMRMINGQLPLWDYHHQRLKKGLHRLALSPPDMSVIQKHLRALGQQQGSDALVIKLLVYRSTQARTYQPLTEQTEWLLTSEPLLKQAVAKPLRLAVAHYKLAKQPVLAGIKHLNRLEQVLAAKELSQFKEIDDLLILDQKQRVIETSYQNVILLKQDEIFTPELKDCGVDGVALQWLKDHFVVNEIDLTINDLVAYDGMMVCNSIRGFQTVKTVESVNSFVTKHAIQDKIVQQWAVFNHS